MHAKSLLLLLDMEICDVLLANAGLGIKLHHFSKEVKACGLCNSFYPTGK